MTGQRDRETHLGMPIQFICYAIHELKHCEFAKRRHRQPKSETRSPLKVVVEWSCKKKRTRIRFLRCPRCSRHFWKVLRCNLDRTALENSLKVDHNLEAEFAWCSQHRWSLRRWLPWPSRTRNGYWLGVLTDCWLNLFRALFQLAASIDFHSHD